MTTPVPEVLTHTLTGRYDVTRELGRGGMAIVYLASDRRHERQVAIKVLLRDLTASIDVERFLREIRVVAGLQHPHILPLFDSGEAGGLLYFVMPFINGESLRSRLDRAGALPLEEAARVLRQVADALDYAHTRGVVHRDVKPENILVSGGQAFLADFGVARATAAGISDAGSLTSIGVTLGTPAYMSPEQAAAEPHLDGRSDIYSLGCVCYEMLVGVPPFRAGSAAALMSQHILNLPPPLVEARGLPIPDKASAAVVRALAKDPADRFGTAGSFAAAVEQAAADAHQPSAADLRIRAVERRHDTKQRVLVLEFANITGAADADWLSTGIAETVSADLNKIAAIKIVGQDAATRKRVEAARRGRFMDAEQALALARSLGAQWVLWGAFQKLGPRIRITTHFTGTADGTPVREEKIDGLMDDIFALQDRIVTSLAAALGIQLTGAEVAQIRLPETTDLTAYEHYAKGYRAYLQFGKASVMTAEDHFRVAIGIDPSYALAHAGLGVIHGPRYIATGKREVLEEGASLLQRALDLDPSIGEAHAWLAYIRFRQDRFDDAEQTARNGIENDPSSFLSWYMLGCSHLCRAVVLHRPADLARAVPPLLRAIALNASFHPAHMALGSLYILRGAYAHATGLIDRAVEVELSGAGLQFVGSLVQRAVLHLGSGEWSAAAPLLDRAIRRYSGADHVYAETMNAYAHFARGCLAERTGELGQAIADLQLACEIADANPHRIDIGAHWVKSRFGLARVLYRTGREDEARQVLAEGRGLFETRSRFIWTWFVGGVDADVLYELASALATMGRTGEVLGALERAADAGWADVSWLRHDPAFRDLRDTGELQRLSIDAASRVVLPPPVGSGGLGG